MQRIEYYESPSPHVVIENFLPIPAARECLEEAQWLEPIFQPASTIGMAHEDDVDDCEECKARLDASITGIRSNDVVYLDSYYRNRRHESKILLHLEQAFMSRALKNAFAQLPHLFPLINQTTHMETILSSYGMCDFYGFHTDTLPHQPSSRILTCVLHWNTEPQRFEGGELILTGDTIQDQYAHQPSHNTAVFFQSNQCVHAVGETRHEGSFKDSRFSINLWLGFEHREHHSDELNDSFKYR